MAAMLSEAVQDSKVRGLGIEERALLAKQRARKVVGFPGNRHTNMLDRLKLPVTH